ncbi:MAG: SMC-Scp complex subunit ScpB [Fusobacteria bacterium]|nr:MAG: SMC-Scp complex subunit ScpB [Fusobacteriota bacterium]
MKYETIKKELEAIIYLGSEVEIKELARYYNLTTEKILDYLYEIKEEIKENGINLKIENDITYFETNPKYGEVVHNFFNQESKPKKLSRAAMETLSIIAYKQPITRSHIEGIRGVSVDRVIHNLEEKGLIYASGKLETIGKPNLYSTTENFLNYLGISNIAELPNYDVIVSEIGEKNGESKVK